MAAQDLHDFLAESRQLEKDYPLLARLHLLLPAGVVVAAGILLYFTGDLARVAAAAVAALFYLGKFVILTGSAPESTFRMNSWELAALVFCMDIVVAYFFAFNLHHVYRVPKFGPWIERLQQFCRYWLSSHPWTRKWAFSGVMLFVMFPLTGTGAPGGSILGRIVGLRPRVTMFAIGLGSALGSGLMAAFAVRLKPVFDEIRDRWWFQGSGLLILAILLLVIIRLGRWISLAAERHARAQESGGDG